AWYRACRQGTGTPGCCGPTCRRRSAAARHGCCAWVISLPACPVPLWKKGEANRIRGSPTGAVTLSPRNPQPPARDRSDRVLGISRNDCSGSIGTQAARDQSESLLAITRCAQTAPARQARRLDTRLLKGALLVLLHGGPRWR